MLEMTVLERQRARQIHCRIVSPASTPASRVDDFQDLVTPGEISSTEFRSSITGRSTSPEVVVKKRKGKNVQEVKEWKGGKSREKKMKPNIKEAEDQSKITEQTEMTKQSSIKASPRLDFVHVRARRGQATDSHSLAERARREKISERMKYLQNLVPGCNKIAGKAGMLDEIINYVQSLQQQVEFLSMKLAALNPRLDFINVDRLFVKQEILQVFPTIEVSPETANSSSYLNQLGIGSSSVAVPETPLINSASIPDFELSSTWGDNLLSLYSMSFDQGGPPLLSPSSFLSEQRSGIEDENETLFDLDHNKVVPF